jgi:hypothetical protein
MAIGFYRNRTSAQLNAQNACPNRYGIDFSKETIIFTKMEALVQSGNFAQTRRARHGYHAVSSRAAVTQTPKWLIC